MSDQKSKISRRYAAIDALFRAVEEFGHAEISFDMEDYGREPGDIVTVTVGLDETASRTGELSALLVEETSRMLRDEHTP